MHPLIKAWRPDSLLYRDLGPSGLECLGTYDIDICVEPFGSYCFPHFILLPKPVVRPSVHLSVRQSHFWALAGARKKPPVGGLNFLVYYIFIVIINFEKCVSAEKVLIKLAQKSVFWKVFQINGLLWKIFSGMDYLISVEQNIFIQAPCRFR